MNASRLVDPVADTGCLSKLVAVAEEEARTTYVRNLAAQLGDIPSTVWFLQQLPQLDDDGSARGRDAVVCNRVQRLRRRPWPRNPNCFERAMMFLALAANLPPDDPSDVYTATTFHLPSGALHTTAVRSRRRDGSVLFFELAPAVRNGEWYQDVFEVAHGIGGTVLGVFGAGGVAEPIGQWEIDAGLRERKAAKGAAGGAAAAGVSGATATSSGTTTAGGSFRRNFYPPAGTVQTALAPDLEWDGAAWYDARTGAKVTDVTSPEGRATLKARGKPGTAMQGAYYDEREGAWFVPNAPRTGTTSTLRLTTTTPTARPSATRPKDQSSWQTSPRRTTRLPRRAAPAGTAGAR